ncbi:MAG: hypothetical protein GKR89_07805 [Candidatus Latescibacteria bacterium]|nr:hypothetical protein [Candidatus Latescibacterota bacterium]
MSPIDYQQPFHLLSNRVWRSYRGGCTLDQIEGKEGPADGHFPEDWVGSATRAVNPGREHLADEGVGQARGCDGRICSMEELYTGDPQQALGRAHATAFGAEPRLLVKLLDSAMRLHVQAHPSAAWAQRHLNASSGKTEAWWILATRTDPAWVLVGFQRPPTEQAWRRMVEEQDLEAMLACFDRIAVRPGDVLLIEGGVPHAIGPGVAMLEIQEPTDFVVRCEYAHGGVELPESARTMGLGLDRVLDLFDYNAYPAAAVTDRFGPRPQLLASAPDSREEALLAAPQTDRLEARRLQVDGQLKLYQDGRFSILVVLEGKGHLYAGGQRVELAPWTRLFLPAALDSVVVEGQLTAARCLPPCP